MSRALLAAARAIAKGKTPSLSSLARETFASGATRADAQQWFLDEIRHYVYAGDTLLHVAAAVGRASACSVSTAAPGCRQSRSVDRVAQ